MHTRGANNNCGKHCVSLFSFSRRQRVESKKKEREEWKKDQVANSENIGKQMGKNKVHTVFRKWRRIIRTLREVDQIITRKAFRTSHTVNTIMRDWKITPPPTIYFAFAIKRANTPGWAPVRQQLSRKRERESISTRHGKARATDNSVTNKSERAGRRPLLPDLFSYDSMRITALEVPATSSWIYGWSIHADQSAGYLDAAFAARYTSTYLPIYLPHRQKETTQGRQGKKWSSLRGSWYLLVASGSLPSALLRLVIARGCEQKGQGARKRERDYVCVCG